MIGALTERLLFSQQVQHEIVTLFVDTLKWGEQYPLPRECAVQLLQCWDILFIGCNIPWEEYDVNKGTHFLGDIVRTNPQAVINYVEERTRGKISKRDNIVAYIAIALHAADAIEDISMAQPLLERLAKKWETDTKKSPQLVLAMGGEFTYIPWDALESIHDKLAQSSGLQKVIKQWMGVTTAALLWDFAMWAVAVPSHDKRSHIQFSTFEERISPLHAEALKTKHAQEFFFYKFGFTPRKNHVLPTSASDIIENMGVMWDLMELRTSNEKAQPLFRGVVDLLWDKLEDNHGHNNFKYEPWTGQGHIQGYLCGARPELHARVQDELNIQAGSEKFTIGLDFFEFLRHVPEHIYQPYRDVLSAAMVEFLWDDLSSDCNLSQEQFTDCIGFLTFKDIEKLGASTRTQDKTIFWAILENPEGLSPSLRAKLMESPSRVLPNALLFGTFVESYGVEYWSVPEETSIQWLEILAAYYPENIEKIEQLQCDCIRETKRPLKEMAEMVFSFQKVDKNTVPLVLSLTETPNLELPSFQRSSVRRSWRIGMPQMHLQMEWLPSILLGLQQHEKGLELPSGLGLAL